MLSGEVINTNVIVFGLTQSGALTHDLTALEANHYTTDAFLLSTKTWCIQNCVYINMFLEI